MWTYLNVGYSTVKLCKKTLYVTDRFILVFCLARLTTNQELLHSCYIRWYSLKQSRYESQKWEMARFVFGKIEFKYSKTMITSHLLLPFVLRAFHYSLTKISILRYLEHILRN